MTRPSQSPNHGEAGQVLALFAGGLLAIIAGVALVVDGGNAYANQRISQNASDAAAEAGALVLAEKLSGGDPSDSDVKSAVNGVLTAMELDADASSAEYTSLDGTPLGIVVGEAPDDEVPSTASGVAVVGQRDFGTFFARVLGFDALTATTEATAVAGWTRELGTNLLPVTPPLNIVTCDGQNDIALQVPLRIWDPDILLRVPLCKNGPGNVGWIDWSPPSGGTSELEAE